jgi:hypothetical protein
VQRLRFRIQKTHAIGDRFLDNGVRVVFEWKRRVLPFREVLIEPKALVKGAQYGFKASCDMVGFSRVQALVSIAAQRKQHH